MVFRETTKMQEHLSKECVRFGWSFNLWSSVRRSFVFEAGFFAQECLATAFK